MLSIWQDPNLETVVLLLAFKLVHSYGTVIVFSLAESAKKKRWLPITVLRSSRNYMNIEDPRLLTWETLEETVNYPQLKPMCETLLTVMQKTELSFLKKLEKSSPANGKVCVYGIYLLRWVKRSLTYWTLG